MDLRSEILKEHSRRQALKIAGWIGNDPEKFSRLIDLFLHDEYRVVQRAAYPLSMVADKYPKLAEKSIHLLVKRLYDTDTHIAVKRNVIRILQFVEIPKKLHAEIMNLCFSYLQDPNEAIAVKCFSLTVLGRLVKEYPEIKNELITTIETYIKYPTAGMKVRIKRIMKDLNKI